MSSNIGINSVALNFNVSSNTAVKIGKFVRMVATLWINQLGDGYKIGGPGIIVQVDESLFSKKRKYNTGNAVDQIWVR